MMFKWLRRDQREHERSQEVRAILREEIEEQRALTPVLAAQARRLAEARATNHFVQALSDGFKAKTKGV